MTPPLASEPDAARALAAGGAARIDTDDGQHLHVRQLRRGEAGRPPVLFVHALAMDGTMWSAVAERLPAGLAALAVDCRGHGRSAKPPGPYRTARFADDLAAVLDALGLASAVVVGCSMGGTVAQAFAGRYPQRVAGLVLIDTTAWYGPGAEAAWEQRAAKGLGEGLAALVPFQAERWFSPAFSAAQPQVLAEAVRVFLANDEQAYAEACRMLGRADERSGLAHYRGPACVVVGEDDYATPLAMAEDIAARIPGATLQVVPGTRHYTPLEAPQAVADAVQRIVQSPPTGDHI